MRGMKGTRVGHYQIIEQLGEGGMGVVYRARDLKLERFVALKFLPRHRTGQEAERDRFLQEARAASALNHPHVCVIHAIDEHDGEPFIVMELVEGETLRARIARGPVPIEQAMTWAIQIGEALQDAHAHGVIHRDVKTENIMISSRGQAKVMDFGLARLKGLGQSTQTLSTLGTLAYMAPEQLREGMSDARSDLYAFGVVVYELLTGRQPFRGEQHAAVMYAILNTEPEPVQSARPGLASGWQHIIDRALEKDPADRYQSVADMVIELRRLQREILGGARRPEATGPVPTQGWAPGSPTGPVSLPAAATGHAAAPVAVAAPGARRLNFALIGAALLVAAAAAWFLWPQGPPRLSANMTFRTLQLPAENIAYPGMSKDGKWIAFPAADANNRWDLYFMNVGGSEARRITTDSSTAISYVDVSPDGGQIAYSPVTVRPFVNTAICVVPSLGGASRVLAPKGQSPRWSPDGQRVGYILGTGDATAHRLELWSVRSDGTDRRIEYRDTVSISGRISFDWSPDGRSIAWLRSYPNNTQEMLVVTLASGRERALTHDGKNIDEVCWTRQNEIIYSSNRGGNSNLWMVRARGGPPVQITKGAGPDLGMRISADGRTLLYMQQQQTDRLWLTSLDHPAPRQVPMDEVRLGDPALSADGTRIAVPAFDTDPIRSRSRLVVMKSDGSERRWVTTEQEFAVTPMWAPKGDRLAFGSLRDRQPDDSMKTWVVSTGETAAPSPLTYGTPAAWASDTSLIVARKAGYFLHLLPDGHEISFTHDSVTVLPLTKRGFDLVIDTRPAHMDVSVRTHAPDGSTQTRSIGGLADNRVFSPDLRFFLRPRGSSPGFATRISLPDLKETDLPGYLGPLNSRANSIGWDGESLIFCESRYTSKLVLVEGLRP